MTLQGSTKDFPLESVVGLLAGTSKTGELQIRGADQVGALGFSNGRLVAAVCGDHGGEDALGAKATSRATSTRSCAGPPSRAIVSRRSVR